MKNFLIETIEAMTTNLKTADDVIYIGSQKTGHQCTWTEFTHLADDVYAESMVKHQVVKDIVIVFNDYSYLKRDVDTKILRERWVFVPSPKPVAEKLPIVSLFTNAWRWELGQAPDVV